MKSRKGDALLQEKIMSLAKRRGFVYPGSELYGGLANSWDFGPLGVELKNNIKQAWWKWFVQGRNDVMGLDSSILLHPKTWEASGHINSFVDPLVDCLSCKSRFRADHLIEEKTDIEVVGLTPDDLTAIISKENISCPICGNHSFTPARTFNLMFRTSTGVIEGEGKEIYLRPETAQGIFINFKQILDSLHPKLPFGVAQIGKAFRNEITPGNFIFRTREFEQMELEYFHAPQDETKVYTELSDQSKEFFLSLGINKEHIRVREHTKEELSHYSSRTQDIEYEFPFGWGELSGIACRSDYDLAKHQEFSGVDLRYTDPESNEKFLPYVVEPSFGVERTVLSVLYDAYHEEQAPTSEEGESDTRVVLKLARHIAPIKVAVFPHMKKQELVDKAKEVYASLMREFRTLYDESGSIGKRYRRQDEIGTPFCVTIDYDTLKDEAVTLRDRDTMEQERVPLKGLVDYLKTRL